MPYDEETMHALLRDLSAIQPTEKCRERNCSYELIAFNDFNDVLLLDGANALYYSNLEHSTASQKINFENESYMNDLSSIASSRIPSSVEIKSMKFDLSGDFLLLRGDF
eukprot:CAMPEP_0171483180 /NCGR_PEP_ID=MMETSP0946-20130122/7979_1 /TAXON_ID=109269 /ORGANISM="Vaucheria litorea, Strain CCMP2940" /LENGTH=108 /DNA_ID=CAMNT_0012015477 /DNA_START=29 /DNA_END=352 /DNA_ORIENTATION=-